jgi:hypothetical protein
VDERKDVCNILDMMTKALIDKYLGLPSIGSGMDQSDCFHFLIDYIGYAKELVDGRRNYYMHEGRRYC